MLQNARVTAFIVSELLKENQQERVELNFAFQNFNIRLVGVSMESYTSFIARVKS